jgi:hypothetical protein
MFFKAATVSSMEGGVLHPENKITNKAEAAHIALISFLE